MAGTPIFTIEPNPHWVIIDNFSKLPPGAAIYTYRSLDPSQFKPAFQDPGGQIPYGQPIDGFQNGTFPPIYWEFDPNNPTDTYYIEVYSARKENNGVLLWTFDGLSGGGSGGGGTVIEAFDLENLIINGTFYRNIGDMSGGSLPTLLTLAPSANAGFVTNLALASTTGPASPDIIFAKKNNTATDSISFPPFSPLGVQALVGDVTPPFYFNYSCAGDGAGETYKYVQFPVSQGVQNLSNQALSFKFFAKSSFSNTITLTWRLYFGDGGGSADVLQTFATIVLTPNWQVYEFDSVAPDATGGTVGACGNDGLFLQINLPASPVLSSVDFIKPAVYLGNIPPGIDFHTNDMIDANMDTARTGDIRISLNSFLPGWVVMNDGTIGDASSNATSRKNIDTFPLFSLIWNLFVSNQTLAPMFTSGGVPTAYGASAIADFIAHNQLSLTVAAGRVFAGVSGSHLIGTSVGSETHTLLAAELPPHVHTYGSPQNTGAGALAGGTAWTTNTATLNTGNGPGTSTPFSILQPTVYMNVFIKL